MVIHITERKLFAFLILLTPIVDTINGWYVITFQSDGFSLGTIYRGTMICYYIYILFKYKSKKINYLLALLYFPIKALIYGLYYGSLIQYLSYAMKWIFPVLTIMTFEQVYRKENRRGYQDVLKILDFFSVIMPLLLVVEYILGVGLLSYYDAGFKGLYYSTNDIAFALTTLFIYSFFKLMRDFNWKNIICVLINVVAIVVLSTKSCILFVVITIVYYGAISWKNRKSIRNYGFVIFSLLIGVYILLRTMTDEIGSIFIRYSNMWEYSQSNNVFKDLLTFLTSGRTNRIDTFFSLNSEDMFSVRNLLFGWVVPDNAHVIEMDWHDLLCQYGILGLILVLSFYLIIYIKRKNDEHVYIFIIGMICVTFSGHVISGAMAGTIFALVCCLLRSDIDGKACDNMKDKKYI